MYAFQVGQEPRRDPFGGRCTEQVAQRGLQNLFRGEGIRKEAKRIGWY